MENYTAVKHCAGGQRPPLRLRQVQMGYKRCAEVAPYGIIRYQTKPADAVHDHRANELRDTDIPQGTLSCSSGNSPCVALAEGKLYV